MNSFFDKNFISTDTLDLEQILRGYIYFGKGF
mgnify:CR=1 FL=1